MSTLVNVIAGKKHFPKIFQYKILMTSLFLHFKNVTLKLVFYTRFINYECIENTPNIHINLIESSYEPEKPWEKLLISKSERKYYNCLRLFYNLDCFMQIVKM